MTYTGPHMLTEARSVAGWPRVVAATFVRDMRIAASYRTGFVLSIGGSVLQILGVLFLSEAVGPGAGAAVDAYGGNYFSFAAVGVAFSAFMAAGLTGIASRIREGQLMGTLELMLLSPNPLGLLLLASSVWGHARALLTLVIYIAVAVALGADVSRTNLPTAVAALVLSVLAFNAVGLISASFVIVLKQGNPVALAVGLASALLGGVLYPVTVLPGWLQAIAALLPLTHALELMRRSILVGEDFATLAAPFASLALLTAILLPVGLWACSQAVRIAQTDGSLAEY